MPTPLPNSAAMDALVEELLTKDVYIVDYLPRTVPKNSGGQYFDVEYHLLNSPHHTAEMQQLLAPIAASEGLFFRAAET